MPAVNHLPNKWRGEAVGKFRIECANVRESSKLIFIQPDLECRKIITQLRSFASTDQYRRDPGTSHEPGQRHLRQCRFHFRCDATNLAKNLPIFSLNLLSPNGFAPLKRPVFDVSSFLYLPVRKPPAQGLYGMIPIPPSSAAGTCSRSIVRATSEYSSCIAMGLGPRRSFAMVAAFVANQAGISERAK